MRLAFAAAAVAASACLTACSVPDQKTPEILGGVQETIQPSAAPKPSTPSSSRLIVYFVDSNSQLVSVARSDPYSGLNIAIGELLAGPTSAELGDGLSSAIPVGTKLIYASISGSTARLDFSNDLASISGHEQLLAFAQIVVTSGSIPGIALVQISVAGQAVNAPQPDGTLAEGPVAPSEYASLVKH
jgi:spore germination protein GerM